MNSQEPRSRIARRQRHHGLAGAGMILIVLFALTSANKSLSPALLLRSVISSWGPSRPPSRFQGGRRAAGQDFPQRGDIAAALQAAAALPESQLPSLSAAVFDGNASEVASLLDARADPDELADICVRHGAATASISPLAASLALGDAEIARVLLDAPGRRQVEFTVLYHSMPANTVKGSLMDYQLESAEGETWSDAAAIMLLSELIPSEPMWKWCPSEREQWLQLPTA